MADEQNGDGGLAAISEKLDLILQILQAQTGYVAGASVDEQMKRATETLSNRAAYAWGPQHLAKLRALLESGFELVSCGEVGAAILRSPDGSVRAVWRDDLAKGDGAHG